MRRSFPLQPALLLLVCAQSAGLMHGIGHASARHDAASAADRAAVAQGHSAPGNPETADGSCEKCFQFASFSGGVAPAAPAFVLADTVDAPARIALAALVARAAPASRSRGPPLYL